MRPTNGYRTCLRSQALTSAIVTMFVAVPSFVPGPSSLSYAQSLSDEDDLDAERARDVEEADRAFDGIANGQSEIGIPNPGVLDQMMEQGAAVVQFTCTVKESALYGISAMGRREGLPIDMEVTLTETGIAIVNGQAIQPTGIRPRTLGAGDGPIESALYPMEEVRRALTGSAFQLPSAGFSLDEQRQLEGFGGILNGMMDGMTAGRNRHMMVTLKQNNVVFFDIAAGNRVANAQTALCQSSH